MDALSVFLLAGVECSFSNLFGSFPSLFILGLHKLFELHVGKVAPLSPPVCSNCVLQLELGYDFRRVSVYEGPLLFGRQELAVAATLFEGRLLRTG